ncbi:MAG: hypothetical protein KIT72_05120 [Polyangiaceae bacterium]|nr:hypothetical protein [Polyangiaceae bacterium]MCW5789785.1 hypothetical protein [Polyangiaceae bacterium]
MRSPAKQRAATRAAPRAKTKPAPVKQRDGGAASPSKPAPKAAPVKRPVTKDAPDASGKDAPGKDAKETEAEAGVVKVESDKEQEGMKTYTFGPQEVEGRLRSPQIQYFLRRVRAEFAAGELGHRSFMRELSHTRYHRSVR